MNDYLLSFSFSNVSSGCYSFSFLIKALELKKQRERTESVEPMCAETTLHRMSRYTYGRWLDG